MVIPRPQSSTPMFELIEERIVNGNVNISISTVGAFPITNEVEVCSFGSDGLRLGCVSENATLQTGPSSQTFSLGNIIPAQSGSTNKMITRYSSPCENYSVRERIYNNDGVFRFHSDARLDVGLKFYGSDRCKIYRSGTNNIAPDDDAGDLFTARTQELLP